MSLYLGNDLISGNKPINLGVRNIGEIVASTLPLTDAGLHLLDGSLILGGGIYQGFVDYIADLYAENPTANYFCTESEWQTAVTTYGVCGKFVYDSTNNTVRLPKITGIIEGTTDLTALGDLVEAGLPNITGSVNIGVRSYMHPDTSMSGAFQAGSKAAGYTGNNSETSITSYSFDASRSSSIYGNSTTVQPQTIKCFVYIVIANSTKTDIQVDIDEVVTDLNGKADVDLSNINASQSAKNEIISWGMPDYSAGISITFPYTVPCDGYIWETHTGKGITITIDGDTVSSAWAFGGDYTFSFELLPVSKNQIVSGSINTNASVKFYPMKGAN